VKARTEEKKSGMESLREYWLGGRIGRGLIAEDGGEISRLEEEPLGVRLRSIPGGKEGEADKSQSEGRVARKANEHARKQRRDVCAAEADEVGLALDQKKRH